MSLDYDAILGLALEAQQETTSKDAILYALGLGIGSDPMDPDQLAYVYEDWLKAFPTQATMLCRPPLWFKDPAYGVDWQKFLHAEQSLVMHRPLPPQGKFTGTMRVTGLYDHGPDKGAYIYQTRTLTEVGSDDPIATMTATGIARGNGGFGGPPPPATERPTLPQRDADVVCDLPTLPQAALIYRLSGDPNPLHIDPAVAKRAGFERPILHGLCTFGMAGHALVKSLCGYQAETLASLSARFSAPVIPGETIRTEMWVDGANVAFRCTVVERGVVVLNYGKALIR
jgi:acyl dehydratase